MHFGIEHVFIVLFFVISGFGISASLHSRPTPPSGWSAAWALLRRRWWRIWPPVIAVLLWLAIVRYGLGFSGAGWRTTIEPYAWFFHATLTSWIPGLGSPDSPWSNPAWVTGPHWTLGYELQFYIFIAICVGTGLARAVPVWAIPALMLIVGSAWNILSPNPWSGTLIECAAFFGLGGLAYAVRSQSLSSVAKVVVPIALVLMIPLTITLGWVGTRGGAPGEGTRRLAAATCFVVMLLVLSRWDQFWKPRWWSIPFNALGTISYSLFLIHPVNGPICRSWTERLLPANPPHWLWTGVYLGFQIALAAAFWWVVERPLTAKRRSA